MRSDPIADMLTQIRNALLTKKTEVVVPFSKLKKSIAQILEQEGYLAKITEAEAPNKFKLILKYDQDNLPQISKIKRVSKPGRRIYTHWNKLPWVLNNYGISIVSTSRGLMTNREARRRKIGGEIICEVY